MRCPYCRNEDSKVIDSRNVNESIRRRRECLRCGQRFSTQERIETATLYIIKKDGRREEFSHNKLISGIRKACEKRPLAAGTIERMVDEIEGKLLGSGKEEIPSSEAGELVMEHLRNLDQIAYIRFASVYRHFTDLEDVRREVEALETNPMIHVSEQLPLLLPVPQRKTRNSASHRTKVLSGG